MTSNNQPHNQTRAGQYRQGNFVHARPTRKTNKRAGLYVLLFVVALLPFIYWILGL